MSEEPKKVNADAGILEEEELNYDNYEVVRGEYYAQLYEPTITFIDSRVYVNAACIKQFPESEYCQILISEEEQKLLVRPCSEEDWDSFRWCSKTSKRTPKHVKCIPLFVLLFEKLNWNIQYKYQLIGKLRKAKDGKVFQFDLTTPKIFLREVKEDNSLAKASRIPSFPEQWKNQFGIKASEHAIHTKINVFDGYTIFNLGGNENARKALAEKEESEPTEEIEESNAVKYEQLSLAGIGDRS